MVKVKCIPCGRIFEAESLEDAVCPFCGAMGDKLVLYTEAEEDDYWASVEAEGEDYEFDPLA
ncbi:MAG: hypothetical protein IJ113_07110 [Eggerthellaceae bacterium]|nr:hypothetical protein [Eggerthellaceae bacterium]